MAKTFCAWKANPYEEQVSIPVRPKHCPSMVEVISVTSLPLLQESQAEI
jgi:hypothetical protein